MPHDVRMNPLLDQSLFYHRFDEAVNYFGGSGSFPCKDHPFPVPGRGDAPELLALPDHVDDGLVAVGFEIPGFEVTGFGFP